MKRAKFSIGLVALMISVHAYSQQFSNTIQYNISVPVSNTANYINTTSFRGISMSPRMHFNDAFSLGVTGGWQVFYEKVPPAAYVDDNTTLYGTQFRYINAFPLYLSPQVHLRGSAKVKPYAGLGVGTTYFLRTTQMGLYAFKDKQWLLGLHPEVGVVFPFRNDWHFNVNGRYNHLFEAGDIPTQGYWGINVGLTRIFGRYR